jgi:hypothetical protein
VAGVIFKNKVQILETATVTINRLKAIAVTGILLMVGLGACVMGAENNRGKYIIGCPIWSQGDEGWRVGAKALETALKDNGYSAEIRYADAPPVGRVIFARRSEGKPADAYSIGTIAIGESSVVCVEGDVRGGMYGLFKLAQRVRIGDDPAAVTLKGKPAFGLRMFAEEGQLLDIPDRGYYSEKGDYVNEDILRAEVDEMKEQARQVAGFGFNALSILHLNIEEYIDYQYYDKPVYDQDDRHRTRSKVFCRYMKELCDYVHSLHMDIYIQVYEVQYPPQLKKYWSVSMDDPEFKNILAARYREFFERVPLDGVIITPNDTHFRVAYKSTILWKNEGIPGAAKMCALYHDAIKAAGKQCIFRMWMVGEDSESVEQMIGKIPSDARLVMKETGGDYWLNYPASTAMTSGVARRQPLIIEFDAFREYDNWSRLFIYMKRWGEMVRSCRDTGVIGINCWGDWAEGCIWPDYDPGYLRDEQGVDQQPGTDVSWRGKWNAFRMMTRGFTPGQVNIYLLSRLAWNPDDTVESIAEDFVAMHIGRANAKAVAKALMATEEAFAERFIGVKRTITHPCYVQWSNVFNPNAEYLEKAYQGVSFASVMASNAKAMAFVNEIEKAFDQTRADAAPNRMRYEQFKTGMAKTCLYLRTWYLWRECWWRHRADADLQGEDKARNARLFQKAKIEFMNLMDGWKDYPEEAGYWRITFRYSRPVKSDTGIYVYWYPRGDLTMETSVQKLELN